MTAACPHQLHRCCIYWPPQTLTPLADPATYAHAHICLKTTKQTCWRKTLALKFFLTFSEIHTNTLVGIKKQPLSPSLCTPSPPSCCPYTAYLRQIKRGLILRRAILLDLRSAFSLFHSLQTVFGVRSLSSPSWVKAVAPKQVLKREYPKYLFAPSPLCTKHASIVEGSTLSEITLTSKLVCIH